MNLILLPGNNRSQRSWIDSVEKELSPEFSSTAVHYYDHWWSGLEDAEIDLDAELLKLATTAQQFDKYIIIAQSEGVLLALYGIYEGIIEPDVCIFVGSAFNYAKEYGYDLHSWLVSFDIPTLFIQNEQDPMMGGKELDDLLFSKNVLGHRIVTLPGETNTYPEASRIRDIIFDFYEV